MIHLVCPNPALDRTLIVDEIEKNIPLRPTEVREYPGGKSFNVAYALRKNGEQNYLIHTILGGRIGQYIKDLNQSVGNQLQVVENSKNTRICNIYVERQTGDVALFYENGLDLTPTLLEEFTEQLEASLSEGDFLVFSGSLMKGMPDDYIQQMIDRHPNVHTVVDTSGVALRSAYQAKPSLIKINNEELKDLYPELDEQNSEEILTILKGKVPHDNMIITMGSKGSLAKIGSQFFKVSPLTVDALNPIASGDFYLGILVKGMSKGQNPVDYLAEAAAFSAANCLQYFPEVDLEDYHALLEKVQIEEV